MWRCHVVEPTNYETHKPIASTEKTNEKASGPLQTLPMVALCGGASLKALFQNRADDGWNRR